MIGRGERTEERRFTRVPLELKALVKSRSGKVCARTRNLSLNGLYLSTGAELPLYEWVQIELLLPDEHPTSIELLGKIVRRDRRGAAVQFGPTNLDTFVKFRSGVARVLEGGNSIQPAHVA